MPPRNLRFQRKTWRSYGERGGVGLEQDIFWSAGHKESQEKDGAEAGCAPEKIVVGNRTKISIAIAG